MTVTTCPAVSLIPREGNSASTVAPASYRYCMPMLVKSAPSLTLISRSTLPGTPMAGAVINTSVEDPHIMSLLLTRLDPRRRRSPSCLNPAPSTVTRASPPIGPRVGTSFSTDTRPWYRYCNAFDACMDTASHTRSIFTICSCPFCGDTHSTALSDTFAAAAGTPPANRHITPSDTAVR